jgi:hypothetical protein
MKLQIAACALLATIVGGNARAQQAPSPQFTREYDAGRDAYRLGKLQEAREHLEKAKAFEPKLPGPYRYLAAVDQAEQKFAECVNDARTAMQLNPQSSELPDTIKLHDACRASLGRPSFEFSKDSTGGAISVTSNVEGAAVTLNGLKYGATPLAPREVVAGEAEIGVSKIGYLPQTKKVIVLAAVVTDVDVTLAKDPSYKEGDNGGAAHVVVPTTGFLVLAGVPNAAIQLDGKPITPAGGEIEADPGVHEVIVDSPGMERWRRRVRFARGQKITVQVAPTPSGARASSRSLGLTLVSIGAVLAAGAAGTGMYSYRQAEIAHDWVRIEQTRPTGVPITETGTALPVHTRADIDAQNAKARNWGYVSDAALAAGAVAVGIGIYYLRKDRPADQEGKPAPFAIAPILGNGDTGFVVTKEVRW